MPSVWIVTTITPLALIVLGLIIAMPQPTPTCSFSSLFTPERIRSLHHTLKTSVMIDDVFAHNLVEWRTRWQSLHRYAASHPSQTDAQKEAQEHQQVDWLIEVFNGTFWTYNTRLKRGLGEPEYFPATQTQPAYIEFAHGFFASALHEVSHWCIAGAQRRTQSDFGYWYAPDGRSQAQQAAFERVEIKPQAIECLLTLACGRSFAVSQDNLFAEFDTTNSTFAYDVHAQAMAYIDAPKSLPKDAQTLLWVLLTLCHAEYIDI